MVIKCLPATAHQWTVLGESTARWAIYARKRGPPFSVFQQETKVSLSGLIHGRMSKSFNYESCVSAAAVAEIADKRAAHRCEAPA